MSDSRISWSACIISATRAARRSLSPKRISAVATRVVLVDHRDAAEAEQRVERGARVEVAAAVLGVVQRQQQLRGGEALGGQRLAPGLREADLADRGGGLLFLQPQARAGAARASGARARWRPRRPRSRRRRARAARRCRRRHRPARRCAARPASWSTTSALPIFTTRRRAAAREGIMPISLPACGGGLGRSALMRHLRLLPSPAARGGICRAATRAAPPARPGR